MNYCGSIKGMDNHGENVGKLNKRAQIMHSLLREYVTGFLKENAMHNKFEFESLGLTTML